MSTREMRSVRTYARTYVLMCRRGQGTYVRVNVGRYVRTFLSVRAQVDKQRLSGSGIAQADMRAAMGLSDEECETPRKKRFRETQSENVEVRSCKHTYHACGMHAPSGGEMSARDCDATDAWGCRIVMLRCACRTPPSSSKTSCALC